MHSTCVHYCSLLYTIEYQAEYSNCTDGQLRLSGGDTAMDGRVEICYGNVWFGVCADAYYSYSISSTVCGALGYSSQGMKYYVSVCMYLSHYSSDASGHYGSFADLPRLPLIPYEFRCNGDESSLLDCTKYTIRCWSSYYYYYYYDRHYYSITCQGEPIQSYV